MAKEQEAKAIEIAETAVEVKQLYQEVNTIVHDQTAGIQHVATTVNDTKLEIGGGVDELEQAARLQREARAKMVIIFVIIALILTVIIAPIVVSISNSSSSN